MLGLILLFASLTTVITGVTLITYIQYYEYAPIEDIRESLKLSYFFLSIFELSIGLCGLYSLKTQLLIQFLNWWIFYQGSQKYPYIFNMNSLFPIKMILVTFVKAIISIKKAFEIPFTSLIFPYIIITICILPLLFAFSYPYEDSKLQKVTWDCNDEDILITLTKIIFTKKTRNEYTLYIKNKIKRYISSLYRRNLFIRKFISKSPKYIQSFVNSSICNEEI